MIVSRTILSGGVGITIKQARNIDRSYPVQLGQLLRLAVGTGGRPDMTLTAVLSRSSDSSTDGQ